MAANYIPVGATVQAQALVQALRNLTVGRDQYRRERDVMIQMKDNAASGNAVYDVMAAQFGTNSAQAAALFAEVDSFYAALTNAGLLAAWDQINAKLGVF